MFNNGEMIKNLIREYADRIKTTKCSNIETELMYLLYECELERVKLKTPRKNYRKLQKT